MSINVRLKIGKKGWLMSVLTKKQVRAIEMMVKSDKTIKEIADALNVTDRTIYRWKEKPEFGQEYDKVERKYLDSLSSVAIRSMKWLMLNSDSEQVRFNATKDILDRTGYKPTDKRELDITSQDVIINITGDSDGFEA